MSANVWNDDDGRNQVNWKMALFGPSSIQLSLHSYRIQLYLSILHGDDESGSKKTEWYKYDHPAGTGEGLSYRICIYYIQEGASAKRFLENIKIPSWRCQ